MSTGFVTVQTLSCRRPGGAAWGAGGLGLPHSHLQTPQRGWLSESGLRPGWEGGGGPRTAGWLHPPRLDASHLLASLPAASV